MTNLPSYDLTQFTEMATDVPVMAVSSPSPKLLAKAGRYHVKNVKPYDPALLSRFEAEIYSMDFDTASLEARAKIADDMRFKHGHTNDMSETYSVQVQCMFQQMNFRLLLLPVWMARITEADGDIRPAIINGQTAKAGLGRARKPDK